ncbi:MAG: preprotein translocase subunit SecA [Gammaproteobacteria bacterium]|nr:preprotein translocase subunit SecA [Gammaproteobacteria bacterium]MBU1926718.1 preprotein translocase subunit SecA [Gammaproteobacteria bacterium]
MLLISNFVKYLFGSRNQRVVKRLSKVVKKINALEPSFEKLSDEALRAKTDEFRERLSKGETINNLLVEAFAVVREASKRTLKQRHFDVQLVGGIVLHNGKIAEMCTGEGKTLVATLPAYLNALSGKGVHVVTVNDYLAKRDAEWMEPIYQMLGMTVGVNLADMNPESKRAAYAADITYGTNNEFGFDYLRDNMAFSLEEKVQRSLNYAIVDEVDSILIDEARTPLIISGPTDDISEYYIKVNRLIPHLSKRLEEDGPGDYYLDEKTKQAYLTEEGHQHIEELMYKDGLIKQNESLYDPHNIVFMHYVNAALRANTLFQRDVDYIVTNNEVVIVDEHTGRTMPGRRWSEGLHQAVEAKENVRIQNENQTLATITFQNYFRLYKKLGGMTGTADTEAYEFQQIYNLEVIVIPTHMPLIRKDFSDKVYLTEREKFQAVMEDIQDCVMRGQPALVGTASIEHSEFLSRLLQKAKIPHQVLNAKFHEKEAHIITQAGFPGAVTIATNMAGRGTDIVLGGSIETEIKALDNPSEEDIQKIRADWKARHEAVLQAGGLHVIGSERHESRRIDNQLRGRSGRQGDPGSSRFYVALEDNLMRIFASDRVANLMKKVGMKEGEAIEHPWVSKIIASAQRKVETYHFDVRKQLLEFDDVANDQRKVVYSQRAELMEAQDISETIKRIREDVVDKLVAQYIPEESIEEQWDVPGLQQLLASEFLLHIPLVELLHQKSEMDSEAVKQAILDEVLRVYKEKEEQVGEDALRVFEKSVMLQTLDNHWKEHLSMMDHLRHSVFLSGYAQKDPKQEYKRESFVLFSNMLDDVKYDVIKVLSTVQVEGAEEVEAAEKERQRQAAQQQMYYHHAEDPNTADENSNSEEENHTPYRRDQKVGRNAPCPCGSGKKYKQCCGKL